MYGLLGRRAGESRRGKAGAALLRDFGSSRGRVLTAAMTDNMKNLNLDDDKSVNGDVAEKVIVSFDWLLVVLVLNLRDSSFCSTSE